MIGKSMNIFIVVALLMVVILFSMLVIDFLIVNTYTIKWTSRVVKRHGIYKIQVRKPGAFITGWKTLTVSEVAQKEIRLKIISLDYVATDKNAAIRIAEELIEKEYFNVIWDSKEIETRMKRQKKEQNLS